MSFMNNPLRPAMVRHPLLQSQGEYEFHRLYRYCEDITVTFHRGEMFDEESEIIKRYKAKRSLGSKTVIWCLDRKALYAIMPYLDQVAIYEFKDGVIVIVSLTVPEDRLPDLVERDDIGHRRVIGTPILMVGGEWNANHHPWMHKCLRINTDTAMW